MICNVTRSHRGENLTKYWTCVPNLRSVIPSLIRSACTNIFLEWNEWLKSDTCEVYKSSDIPDIAVVLVKYTSIQRCILLLQKLLVEFLKSTVKSRET